ncbi:MAG: cell division protein FtsQ/DivIB [Chloroflexota bacterium]
MRAIPVAIYLAVLILAAWLLYYSVASPFFAVREVVVSGAKLLDVQQAKETIGCMGQNSLLLQTDQIALSVRSFPEVQNVHVAAMLPGRVEIGVRERTPIVQWKAQDGSFLVDREGIAFSTEPPPGPVMVVKDIDGPSIRLGSRIDPTLLADVEVLMGALSEIGIRFSEFEYSQNRGISVPVQDGPAIVFGDASDLESKLAALSAISTHLETTKARAETIDLRFKGRPVYTLASSAPAKPGQPRP